MSLNPYGTPLKIVNAAALSVGEKPLLSLTDNSAVAIAISGLYELRAREALGSARWRFSMAADVLARESLSPLERYSAVYAAPSEALVVHSVSIGDVEIPFERYGDEIHCTAALDAAVVADYGWRAPEEKWTPLFCAFVVALIAADIARGPMRKPALAAEQEAIAEAKRRIAASQESQNRNPEKLDVSTFLRFRRQSGPRRR